MNTEAENAMRELVRSDLMPLIEQVIMKRLILYADEIKKRNSEKAATAGSGEAVAWQFRYEPRLPDGTHAEWQFCSKEWHDEIKRHPAPTHSARALYAGSPPASGQGEALLREACEELKGAGCDPCTGSDAPMEDLHGRIADYLGRLSGGAVAWMHREDHDRVISAKTKSTGMRDGGASASSVKPYDVPLGVISLCGAAVDRIAEANKCEPVRYVCHGALTYDNGVATCKPKGGA